MEGTPAPRHKRTVEFDQRLYNRLKLLSKRNHRTVQGELNALVAEAVDRAGIPYYADESENHD